MPWIFQKSNFFILPSKTIVSCICLKCELNMTSILSQHPPFMRLELLKACVKVKKIKDLHQLLENDKGGWFFAKLFKLLNKWHVDLFCIISKLHVELDQDISEVCAKFSVFLSYVFENFERKVRYPHFHRFWNSVWSTKLFCVVVNKGASSTFCTDFCRLEIVILLYVLFPSGWKSCWIWKWHF